MPFGVPTTEQVVSWLENLDEERNENVITNINNCDAINLTIFLPEEGDITDCDDGDEEEFTRVNEIGRGVLVKPCEIQLENMEISPENLLFEESVDENRNAQDFPTASSSQFVSNTSKRTNKPKQTNKKPDKKWKKIKLNPSVYNTVSNEEHSPEISQKIIDENSTRIDLFTIIFDIDFMELIRSKTIKYASFKGENFSDVTVEKLYKYFGIILLSGYSKVPAQRIYWETENDVHNHSNIL